MKKMKKMKKNKQFNEQKKRYVTLYPRHAMVDYSFFHKKWKLIKETKKHVTFLWTWDFLDAPEKVRLSKTDYGICIGKRNNNDFIEKYKKIIEENRLISMRNRNDGFYSRNSFMSF